MSNKIPTAEELEKMIWERYDSFELSHQKNKDIVANILEFILKQRREYAKLHVKAQKEAILEKVETNEVIRDSSRNIIGSKIDKESILSAYPLTNIQ